MKPPRVTWILYGSLEQRTGGTIYDAQIVSGLRGVGFDLDVHSLALQQRGVPSQLLRELARERPDVVVGDELCFRELAFLFAHTPFVPRVLLVHHLTCWESELPAAARDRARSFETRALRHSDAVVTTSHATARRLALEGCRRRIDVVVCGADRLPLLPRATRRDSAGIRFLFVGAVIPRKRVRELVAVFDSVPAPATLRIAGRRDADPIYARTIAGGSRVTFLGEIDEATLSSELAAADALVMPSTLEGYGIVATEAVRAAVPVIATRSAGLEEALAPCPDAVRFVDDMPGFREAMRAFVEDEALRRAMRAAADKATLPTWQEAADSFATVLGRLGLST